MAISLNESKRRKPPAPAVKHSDLPPREVAMPWQGDLSLEKINSSAFGTPPSKSQSNSQTSNRTDGDLAISSVSTQNNQTNSQTIESIIESNKLLTEYFDSVRYLRIWASSPKLKVLTLLATCCSLIDNVYITEELRLKPLAKKLKLTNSNFRKILGRLTADGALTFEKDLSKYGPNGWARYSIRKDLWQLLKNTPDRSE
jgi:hypothetical protein